MALVAVTACSRSDQPTTQPAAAPAATVAGLQGSEVLLVDDDATVLVDGFQFFLKPAEPDVFEIDADASKFMGYEPMLVEFGSRALSGTPPITYTWHFADGTEPGTGDRVSHLFEKSGRIDVFVTAKDGAGDEASAQLALVIYTREEWAKARQVTIESLPTPTPRP